jgi:hypothetical protein
MPEGNTSGYLPTYAVLRVAAALAGASAWDAAPLEIPIAGFDWATFYVSYTRAGAGGAVDMRIQVRTPIAVQWYRTTLLATGVLAAGADVQNRIQADFLTYASTAAGVERVVYGPVQLAQGPDLIRIACRESGAPATPGTVEILAVFRGGE